MTKKETYQNLVEQRKQCFQCSNFTNQSKTDFDTEQIGNWSTWAHDLDAKVMIIGQDYANLEVFDRDKGMIEPTDTVTDSTSYATSTNWYLRELTKLLDLDIGFPNAPNSQPVFLTNAVLCLKQGAMNASIPAKAYRACGTNFLRPLIELIEPQVVITLGDTATRAALRVFEQEIPDAKELLGKNFRDIFQQSAIPVPGLGVTLFPVYHPGRLGQVNRQRIETEKKSGWEWQQEDWRRIRAYLDSK